MARLSVVFIDMKIKINYPKETNYFEDNVAKLKALLISKYIDSLNLTDDKRRELYVLVCEELEKGNP